MRRLFRLLALSGFLHFIWSFNRKNSGTVHFLKVAILIQKLVLTWYSTVETVSAFLTTFVFGPEANSWRKIAKLIVFGISVSRFRCFVLVRKFTIYSQSDISGPFLCQKLRIDAFSNFHVRLESRFIKEDVRIRELIDAAQCIDGEFLGLYRYFSVAKKFITRVWKVISTPFRCPKFRLEVTYVPSLFPKSQFWSEDFRKLKTLKNLCDAFRRILSLAKIITRSIFIVSIW